MAAPAHNFTSRVHQHPGSSGSAAPTGRLASVAGPGSAGAALLLTGLADRRTDRRRQPLALPGGATAALLPVEWGGGGRCSYYSAAGLRGSAATPARPQRRARRPAPD